MKKEYKIDSEIYSEDNLLKAISAFKDVTNIDYKDSVISIEGENSDSIEEVFNELMNYIIYL